MGERGTRIDGDGEVIVEVQVTVDDVIEAPQKHANNERNLGGACDGVAGRVSEEVLEG